MANPSIQAGYIKKVEWAIQVCRSDLNNLRDGDWLNFKEELYEFLTEEIEWSFGLRPQSLSNDDVVALGALIGSSRSTSYEHEASMRLRHNRIRASIKSRSTGIKAYKIDEKDKKYVDQLMALANSNKKLWNRTLTIEDAQTINEALWSMIKSIQSDDYPNFIHFNVPHLYAPMPPDPPLNADSVTKMKATYDKLFAYGIPPRNFTQLAGQRLKLYLIAAGLEKSQIQTCPECSRVFVINRKPRPDKTHHCSKTCAQLAATRRYRKKNEAKVKAGDRDRNRRSYEQKIHRKEGHAHSKVIRRPHKTS